MTFTKRVIKFYSRLYYKTKYTLCKSRNQKRASPHTNLYRGSEVNSNINEVQLADEVVQVREGVSLQGVEELHRCHHHPMLHAVAILVQDVPPLMQHFHQSWVTSQLCRGKCCKGSAMRALQLCLGFNRVMKLVTEWA